MNITVVVGDLGRLLNAYPLLPNIFKHRELVLVHRFHLCASLLVSNAASSYRNPFQRVNLRISRAIPGPICSSGRLLRRKANAHVEAVWRLIHGPSAVEESRVLASDERTDGAFAWELLLLEEFFRVSPPLQNELHLVFKVLLTDLLVHIEV